MFMKQTFQNVFFLMNFIWKFNAYFIISAPNTQNLKKNYKIYPSKLFNEKNKLHYFLLCIQGVPSYCCKIANSLPVSLNITLQFAVIIKLSSILKPIIQMLTFLKV